MAASAGVSSTSVTVNSITAGSVQVHSVVVFSSATSSGASTFSTMLESDPASVFADSSFSSYGTPAAITVSTAIVVSPPPPPPPFPPSPPTPSLLPPEGDDLGGNIPIPPTALPTAESSATEIHEASDLSGSTEATFDPEDETEFVGSVSAAMDMPNSTITVTSVASSSSGDASGRRGRQQVRGLRQESATTYVHSVSYQIQCAAADLVDTLALIDDMHSSGRLLEELQRRMTRHSVTSYQCTKRSVLSKDRG
ncbi:hypothetical protein CYMTET_3401 [Cymbomonas tetramitiformis]|uniref:Uncharacterized protein n=1 Tax=Cymbomonas tetramitiformis TaxID=36881 RepID=A0AAE0H3R5_9CHLO|nr:hypothetical protein CYMTET_3401 [Cymbomonas tetramitiformis]